MKKLIFTSIYISALAAGLLFTNCGSNQSNADNNHENNICHNAFFKLKDSLSSDDRKLFFEEIYKLANIEGVIDFKVVKETSPKNQFEYGATMQFKDQNAYDSYNSNPLHQKFVQEIWMKMVEDFMEIDYLQAETKE